MMAQAIACDLCQQEPAVMMQSNLGNGDTIGVGQACMVTFYASSLTAMLSDAPPEMLNELAPVLLPLGALIGPPEWDAESDIVNKQIAGTEDASVSGKGISVVALAVDAGALQSADDVPGEMES